MAQYRVGGVTVASAATADHGVAALWNPSSVMDVYVREIHIANRTAASADIRLKRITARGTPGSTVTPDITSDVAHSLAPASGALLDLATYSVQPTVTGQPFVKWFTPSTAGAGKVYVFQRRIRVKGGNGLAIVNATTTATAALDVEFVWEEAE